jgi:hypothetical protein
MYLDFTNHWALKEQEKLFLCGFMTGRSIENHFIQLARIFSKYSSFQYSVKFSPSINCYIVFYKAGAQA